MRRARVALHVLKGEQKGSNRHFTLIPILHHSHQHVPFNCYSPCNLHLHKYFFGVVWPLMCWRAATPSPFPHPAIKNKQACLGNREPFFTVNRASRFYDSRNIFANRPHSYMYRDVHCKSHLLNKFKYRLWHLLCFMPGSSCWSDQLDQARISYRGLVWKVLMLKFSVYDQFHDPLRPSIRPGQSGRVAIGQRSGRDRIDWAGRVEVV